MMKDHFAMNGNAYVFYSLDYILLSVISNYSNRGKNKNRMVISGKGSFGNYKLKWAHFSEIS